MWHFFNDVAHMHMHAGTVVKNFEIKLVMTKVTGLGLLTIDSNNATWLRLQDEYMQIFGPILER